MRKADVILGLQWGDEGKGKIVDRLAPDYDIIARFQGGPNAGHTIEIEGSKYILHQVPSGIFHPGITNLVGNGVIIDPVIFFREIDGLKEKGLHPESQLLISRRAHLILPTHRMLDRCFEQIKEDKKIGSTLKGIGPAYTDKTARQGLRTGEIFSREFRSSYENLKQQHLKTIRALGIDVDQVLIEDLGFAAYETLWLQAIERMKDLQFVDGEIFINNALDQGRRVLAEGAQGTLLDVDFGSYPYVTSSNTSVGGVCTGLGIPPSGIGDVYGVFKAYCTRVGNGPFPTELFDQTGQSMREKGGEYGSTTGRPRRCGWLDLPALKYSIMINGVTKLVMMKADVLSRFEEVKVCTGYQTDSGISGMPGYQCAGESITPVYENIQGWDLDNFTPGLFQDLPGPLQHYTKFIERHTSKNISILSLGPERNQTVIRNS